MTTNGIKLPDTIQAIEYFYEQGLTDGLPVVPPTPEAVAAFLEAGGLAPDVVLGTRPSRNWVVTAQKVAVNAIMAGCKAEYAPVVLASIRALLKPEFNASAIAETAGTSAPLIVVNGPIRKELERQRGMEPVRARVAGQRHHWPYSQARPNERVQGDTWCHR